MASDSNNEAIEKLAQLQQAYRDDLPFKLATIDALWQRLKQQFESELLNELYFKVHGLAGSAATYGYASLGEEAHRVQHTLQKMQKQDPMSLEPWAERIESSIRSMTKIGLASSGQALREQLPPLCRPLTTASQHANRGEVLLLEDDDALAEDTAFQLSQFGYRIDRIAKPKALGDCVRRKAYSVAIVDIMFPSGEEEGVDAVSLLRDQAVSLPPVIFISSRQDISARLMAVRSGGVAYFTKPLNIPALAEKLDELSATELQEPYRILIVDDDEMMAEYTATILEYSGMLTEIIHDPSTVQASLESFSPELILMDLYLPGCTGLELAEAIRQQEAYIGTPIVFYSVESSINMHLDAMRRGGDDFLIKPVKPEYLVTKIQARVSRARKIMSLMMRDSLTGLFNHTSLKEYLLREHAQARRYNSPLAYALIDLDNFKNVNDSYGHGAGDQVLKSLAQLLRQRVRKSDIVGRYGGEEFAIIFPGVDETGAATMLEQIREAFGAVVFSAGDERFSVTLSAGVADYQTYPEVADLFEQTDRALYSAKEQGRNRVLRASTLSPD